MWPDGRTAFPDFFKAETQKWWKQELKTFYDQLPFDGIWIVKLLVKPFSSTRY